ncbi:MAG: hypothetical protein ACOY5F_03365 [Pseudomonadota bacterium]
MLIAGSLALAGSSLPKHAHAKGEGAHGAIHNHHMGIAKVHDHKMEHDHGGDAGALAAGFASPGEDGVVLNNCCAAWCASIALIFTTAALPNASRNGGFVTSTVTSLALVSRKSDDPPPR